MANLEHAISLAVQAHAGQVDKAGKPYILHPLRMMCRMKTDHEMMVAVLHDVVEDTPYTLDDLRRAGYPPEVIAGVDAMTHREDESYEDFIGRVKQNPLAIRVKLADIEDNMDIRRLLVITEWDVQRLRKYQKAWNELLAALD